MPRLGGRKLAERLRARRPALKVLLISGYADEPAARSAEQGVAYLPKPFTAEILLREVRRVLDNPID